MKKPCTILGAGLSAAVTSFASAGFVVSAVVDGASTATVNAGDVFSLSVVVTGSPGSAFNSALFRTVFSEGGLLYLGYTWAAPFSTGSAFDQGNPGVPAGAALDEWTLSGPGYEPGVVDVELGNAAFGSFVGGTLVTLLLQVPASMQPGSILAWIEPETFANGFQVIEATGGEVLEINVVPAPATLAIAACAGWVTRRRRAR